MANRNSDRGRSRSPAMNCPAGQADANSNLARSTLPRVFDSGIVLSKNIRCRDPTCKNDTFRVRIEDANRVHEAELECVFCDTCTSIDPTHRVLYANLLKR